MVWHDPDGSIIGLVDIVGLVVLVLALKRNIIVLWYSPIRVI